MSKQQKPLRVVFFGDSICVGQGVSLYRGWVARIAEDLDRYGHEIGREIIVANSSVNGRTTRQALEDMPYHIQSARPDLLLVQFGLNDCNYWQTDRGRPRVSRAAFTANLQEMVDRALAFDVRKIILNTNHPTTRNKVILPNTKITYEDSNKSYNEAIRFVAANSGENVILIDIENLMIENGGIEFDSGGFVLEDGLHLSANGHNFYYSSVQNVIKNTVKSLL